MSDRPGDFTFTVEGLDRVQARFSNATPALHDRLLAIISGEVEQVSQMASARMAELFKNPARMQGTLSTSVDDGTTYIQGTVRASGLPYLRIHEYGGTVMTPDIFPSSAKVLHFFTDRGFQFNGRQKANLTNEVFTRHTAAHPTVLPERSFMRYGLAQRASSIRAAFTQAARDVASGVL